MVVLVLGAGISGLTAAYTLKQELGSKVSVTILEGSDRVGGCIQSIRKNGTLFELGPRSLRGRGNGVATLSLVDELGLTPLPADSSAANRYLLKKGKLQKLSPFAPRVLLSLLREPWIKRGSRQETVGEFFRRRFGSHVVDHLVDPLVTGIFAGDPFQLSMAACFPQLANWERQHGSVLRGAWADRGQPSHPLFSFQDGLETLPKALLEKTECDLHLGTKILEVGQGVVRTDKGTFHGDHIVSTLPNLSLKRSSVVVVNLGWSGDVLQTKGFGYLVPSKENESVLGVVFDSAVFPSQSEGTRLTVMMGGVRRPDLLEKGEAELLALAQTAIENHLGITSTPDLFHVTYWENAIPQYPIGHCPLPASDHLTTLGSSWNGVGVNDCVAHARKEMRALSKAMMYKRGNPVTV